MALSDKEITLGQKYLTIWQRCTSRPMAAHHLEFARAIEAEVRKDDEALIRQLVEALEYHRDQTRPIDRTDQAIAAARARLEQPCA